MVLEYVHCVLNQTSRKSRVVKLVKCLCNVVVVEYAPLDHGAMRSCNKYKESLHSLVILLKREHTQDSQVYFAKTQLCSQKRFSDKIHWYV